MYKRENFRPRSLNVRSPGHVKRPHLRKSFNARQSYTEWPITLKLSAIDTRISIYQMYISEFLYPWPKVRSTLRPLHYKWMGENERRPFWKKPIRSTLKHRVTGRLDTLSRNIATSDTSSCRRGHFRSGEVASSFSSITFDRDELERCKHHHHKLTECNITFSDQVITLTLGQIFNMIF